MRTENPAQHLQARLRDVPHKPGVYLMRDRLKRVIYVGKARDLRKRLANYFTPSRRNAADLKTRALIDSIWDFEIHVVKSEAEAVLYEGRLIKDFRPKYNISFRDDKRFLLVRLHPDDPWPKFQLTRLRREDGARYFGPFANSGALRSTLNAMRKRFGIRSCRPPNPGERDYRHCLDHVIKNCSAPCVGRITREDYLSRVDQACEFLDGASRDMIAQVEQEMQAAAARLDFEKAAQLRNLLDDLRTTAKPMTRFTRKSLPTTVDPASDLSSLADALCLPAPPSIMECFDISNISNTHIVASMVRFKDGVPDRSNYRRFRITGTRGQDDFASMAEVVRRRYRRVLSEAGPGLGADADFDQSPPDESTRRSTTGPGLPDLIIVDGGRGQLSSACRELQQLGLGNTAIIGLAKEFEEIYRPGRPLPLRLPADSGALKLLQRIRDEAHRFANGYHSLLLRRRMKESLLDDVPGVSETRKRALLERFGSVERLRRLPAATLAEVPGVSLRLAEEITTYLSRSTKSAAASRSARASRESQ
ncbi:MAG: excinuclease ABC subunit UvrC [Terrimicrobiaceae bacterium]